MKVASRGKGGTVLAATAGYDCADPVRADGGSPAEGSDRTSIVDRVDEVLQRDYADVDRDDRADGSDARDPGERQSAESSDGDGFVTRTDGDDAEECQNCGVEDDGCERRDLGPVGLSVVLCCGCHAARTASVRSLADCRGTGVPVAAAGADACEACGATASLESHAVVPIDDGGHRHANNLLALCPDCHADVECHRDATA